MPLTTRISTGKRKSGLTTEFMRISGHEEYRSVIPEPTENTRLTIFRLFVAWRERGRIFGRVGSRSRQTRNFHPHIRCQKCPDTARTIQCPTALRTDRQPALLRQNGNRRVVMKIHKPVTIRTNTDLFISEPANRLARTFPEISGKRHDSLFLHAPGSLTVLQPADVSRTSFSTGGQYRCGEKP